MNRISDPVRTRVNSERLHYATGELLGADDFRDEQTYHRRQLARALLFLHGSGAIAGLRATVEHRPGQNGAPDEVHLEVEPGLALDRVGRLIEVPRSACLRLRRWFEFGAARDPRDERAGNFELDRDDLREAFREGTTPGTGTVVADIYLAFHPCDRGYTPAFASGPFDALDASQPSRVRDAYELTLVPRPRATPDTLPVAFDPWAALEGTAAADRLASARARSLDAYSTLAPPVLNHVGAFRDNPPGVDPTAVLLTRITLPAAAAANPVSAPRPDWSAATWPGASANLDNNVRNFLFPPAALRQIAGF